MQRQEMKELLCDGVYSDSAEGRRSHLVYFFVMRRMLPSEST